MASRNVGVVFAQMVAYFVNPSVWKRHMSINQRNIFGLTPHYCPMATLPRPPRKIIWLMHRDFIGQTILQMLVWTVQDYADFVIFSDSRLDVFDGAL